MEIMILFEIAPDFHSKGKTKSYNIIVHYSVPYSADALIIDHYSDLLLTNPFKLGFVRKDIIEQRESFLDYARKVAAISPRILSEFENGTGNPTLATLEKIASPFGLKFTFLPPESWRMRAKG